MPSQTKENYIKAIYFLELRNKKVTITELGEEMEVSKPTVNNMIKKLAAIGWIDYEKYKPITLSKRGKKEAALIVRKHRLTEMFLVEIMGFGWEEVHEIAEEMEHLKSEKFFDRMDHLLGQPQVDPHGSPIPQKTGNVKRKVYPSLSDFEVGAKVVLKAVVDNTDALLKLLNEKGIQLGTIFTVAKIESFDKSMLLNYDARLGESLSYEVCKRLKVEDL